jgi:hypothetical protein
MSESDIVIRSFSKERPVIGETTREELLLDELTKL